MTVAAKVETEAGAEAETEVEMTATRVEIETFTIRGTEGHHRRMGGDHHLHITGGLHHQVGALHHHIIQATVFHHHIIQAMVLHHPVGALHHLHQAFLTIPTRDHHHPHQASRTSHLLEERGGGSAGGAYKSVQAAPSPGAAETVEC